MRVRRLWMVCAWVVLAPAASTAFGMHYGDGAQWLTVCRGDSEDADLRGERGRALCDTALRFFALGHAFGVLEPGVREGTPGEAAAEALDAREATAFCVHADSDALPSAFVAYLEGDAEEQKSPFPAVAYRFLLKRFACKE